MLRKLDRMLRRRLVLRAATTGHAPRVEGWPAVTATNLKVGDDFHIRATRGRISRIVGDGAITFGDRCFVNAGAKIYSVESVSIGDDVALADDCYVFDTHSHGIEGNPPRIAPVAIEDGVWVGTHALILPGVRVGSRAVIAAGSIVTHDVEPDVIVAGNPATEIRRLHYPRGVTRAWQN